MFVQRAGRAARAPGQNGLAILLVERSAYGLDCEQLVSELRAEASKGKGKNKTTKAKQKQTTRPERTTGEYEKSTEKDFASSRGVKRGSRDGKSDVHPMAGWEPDMDPRAKDEGLLAFVQTGSCRRTVLTRVYKNKVSGTLFKH